MASIRRTLSPAYHDRTYQNGGGGGGGGDGAAAATSSPLSLSASSSSSLFQKTFTKHSYSSSSTLSAFLKVIASIFLQKRSRFRRSLYRCLIFFILGFILGMFLFGHVDDNNNNDVQNHDFSFEMKPPHVNVQLDDNNSIKHKHEDDNGFASVSLGAVVVNRKNSFDDYIRNPKKQLIVITPTYNRALQAYYLNRLSQVLKLVQPPLLWIIVEMKTASLETAEMLRKTGVMYRHLMCDKNLSNVKDRGVYQRNIALEHIERHKLDGIVYFADDDNVYSIDLFESLRETSRFGTWPVAMLAQSKNKAILEGPVCNGTEVIGWHTNEKSKRLRRFHVDMSGFAFNSTILWDSKRWRRPSSNPIRQLDTVKEGFQETTFIEQVMEDESQMEGVPPGCSRVLNWHLHLDARGLVYPRGWLFRKNLDVILPIQ